MHGHGENFLFFQNHLFEKCVCTVPNKNSSKVLSDVLSNVLKHFLVMQEINGQRVFGKTTFCVFELSSIHIFHEIATSEEKPGY